MRVFLTYSFEDNLTGITSLLSKLGIEIFDSRSDIVIEKSFQQAIKYGIAECDFLFLIYSTANPNIAFEAGIAVSNSTPIFAVVPPTNRDSPDFLFDSTYVHAETKEIDKIEFNLKIFLDKIKTKKKNIKSHTLKFNSEPKTNWYKSILKNYHTLTNNRIPREKEYEYFFQDVFEKCDLNVIQNKNNSEIKFNTDFCIWSDKLENTIGNPILVEIKREINKRNLVDLNKTLAGLLFHNFGQACIVFYDNLNGIDKEDLPNSSKIFFIQIEEFIETLNKIDFNDSIIKFRNALAHKQF